MGLNNKKGIAHVEILIIAFFALVICLLIFWGIKRRVESTSVAAERKFAPLEKEWQASKTYLYCGDLRYTYRHNSFYQARDLLWKNREHFTKEEYIAALKLLQKIERAK